MAPVAPLTRGMGSQALRVSAAKVRCPGSDPLWWEVGPPDLRRPWPRRGCPPRPPGRAFLRGFGQSLGDSLKRHGRFAGRSSGRHPGGPSDREGV
jgi:hypothetical protein